jgi:hypothetical protein
MEYGYFKDHAYCITERNTPRHWYNYAFNDSTVAFFSQVGYGECLLQDRMGRRIMPVADRALYIVDRKTGGYHLACGLPMRESVAVCIGLVTLFGLVGIAVTIFIPNGIILSKYVFLEEPFIAAYGVKGIVEKRKQSYSFRYIALLTVGTLLCILSVIPLLVFGSLGANDSILICCTGLILVLCSIGVFLMVRACYINGSFERVLQTGDFSAKKKRLAKEHELVILSTEKPLYTSCGLLYLNGLLGSKEVKK